MTFKTFVGVLLLLIPLVSGAPSVEKISLPPDGFIELYNSTLEEETKTEEPASPPEEVSKAAPMKPPQDSSQLTVGPPGIPFIFPRPISIPFPFPFPPPPPQFPNLDVIQVIAVPKPAKNLKFNQPEEEKEEEEVTGELIMPLEIELDVGPEARRAPVSNRRRPKRPKKPQKKQNKKKKQKKQNKQKYPQPIVIYQSQDEGVGNDGTQPSMTGAQGTQSSYLGYYMVYVVEVRWTGNNYTQTVVTGRPVPAAITYPTSTEPINNLSETIMPSNLVNGNRPQPTPTCMFQRSTTTEIFKPPVDVSNPVDNTQNPNENLETGANQEVVGEEIDDSEDLDSVEEEYEDVSDPKRKKKKKKKGIKIPTSPPVSPQQ